MGNVVLTEFVSILQADNFVDKNYISHNAIESNRLPADGFVCCVLNRMAQVDGMSADTLNLTDEIITFKIGMIITMKFIIIIIMRYINVLYNELL